MILKSDDEFNNGIETYTPEKNFKTEIRYDFNYFDFFPGNTWVHKHNYYEFFLVLDGEGIHIVNDTSIPIRRGSIVALNPSDSHAFEIEDENSLKILNLAFSSKTVKDIVDSLSLKGQIDFYSQCPLHTTVSENISRSIVEQCNNFHVYSKLIQADDILLKAFFMNLISIFILNKSETKSREEKFPDWLSNALIGLLEPENYCRGLEYLIEKTGKDQSYLCRIFKSKLNCTPTEYINSIRLSQACFAIEHTDKKIIDICFDCGFSSVSYFNSLFKEKYGVSPDKFRRR